MELYAAIFRNAPDPILLVDASGMIAEANPKAHQALGYGEGELHGLPLERLLPERFAEAHKAHRTGFMAHPRTRPMESGRTLTALRKDGSELPVDIMLSSAEGPGGPVAIAVLRDRSEQIKAEADLRDLKERLKLSADAAGMGYWTYDEAADRFWCDETYAALLGGTPGDFRDADSVRRRISPLDRERRRRNALQSLEAEGRYESEFRVVLSDGSLRWIGELGRSTGPGSGPGRTFAGVSFDISARKADQARAEDAQMRERELLDLAPDGVFVADALGIYTDVNVAGCRLLGLERGEILGKSILDFLHPDEALRLAATREDLLDGDLDTSEWRLRHKGGDYVPVEVSAKIYADGRWLGFVRDIRERKAAEEKRTALIAGLEASLKENRVLKGMLPICSHCKRIRDEEGRWVPIEIYIHIRSDADFSHGICPECLKEHYAEFIES